MLTKGDINRRLKRLNSEYLKALKSSKADAPLYFAKLAIIELCGWIEESFDELFTDIAQVKIQDIMIRQQFLKKLTNNFGFSKKHIKRLTIDLYGFNGYEALEARIDQAKWIPMLASLDLLTEHRNDVSHSTIKFNGVSKSIAAPSFTISHLPPVHVGMKELRQTLRRMRVR